MVKILVEIQASHVGIGKSTFAKRFDKPWVDDCIQLVESDPSFFYGHANEYGEGNNEFKQLLRCYLVLENFAASLDNVASKLGSDWTIIASRSVIISCIQFARQGVNCKPMLNYYKRRLRHLGVDTVLILDYGNKIQMNEQAVKTGYERMLNRGRIFEKEAFDTFEKYNNFFQSAERVKYNVVEEIEKDDFFQYKNVPFYGFNERDLEIAQNWITMASKKAEKKVK
ncbi:uncharacterized protein TNCV_4416872 [Trichonephila clavipes]|uniref:Uncharacterized protein n=2 Tax=Trichonephila clavipes TaxID=2585209 RepID=A0A8X6S4F1_TRICX|nr:uncharacterized protein TNCV_4416872 [Trichonephila clavipes]